VATSSCRIARPLHRSRTIASLSQTTFFWDPAEVLEARRAAETGRRSFDRTLTPPRAAPSTHLGRSRGGIGRGGQWQERDSRRGATSRVPPPEQC
jgi:hypothetical protein